MIITSEKPISFASYYQDLCVFETWVFFALMSISSMDSWVLGVSLVGLVGQCWINKFFSSFLILRSSFVSLKLWRAS